MHSRNNRLCGKEHNPMDITKLKRGMNIDLKPWTPEAEENGKRYCKIIKEAGFDHVRLPFTVDRDDPQCAPTKEFYEVIRRVTQSAVDCGLYAIVDIHPFIGMQADPINTKADFIKFWGELADYLKDMDDTVIFEIYNEPDNDFNYTILNEVQNEAISVIRKTNPTRWIAAACAHCNTIENLMHLELPEDDKNIFVTIHEYTPMKFTHQGADWMQGDWPIGVKWGTEKEKALLEYRFDMAKRWADYYGRYIHLGEFGAMRHADPECRREWTEYLVKLCEERGFGWAYWEFCYSFQAYDLEKGEWIAAILGALIKA